MDSGAFTCDNHNVSMLRSQTTDLDPNCPATLKCAIALNIVAGKEQRGGRARRSAFAADRSGSTNTQERASAPPASLRRLTLRRANFIFVVPDGRRMRCRA